MRWVYFIREGNGGNVKIGTTTVNPHSRLRSMQTGNSSDLVLLAAVQGDDDLEKRLHARFAADRIRGEWFTPTVELLAFIDGVSLAHPLPADNGDDAWPFTAEQAEWMVGFVAAERQYHVFSEITNTHEFVRDNLDDPDIAECLIDDLKPIRKLISHDAFHYMVNVGYKAGIEHYNVNRLRKRCYQSTEDARAKIDRLRAEQSAANQTVGDATRCDTEEYN
jgi:hypothetical protein